MTLSTESRELIDQALADVAGGQDPIPDAVRSRMHSMVHQLAQGVAVAASAAVVTSATSGTAAAAVATKAISGGAAVSKVATEVVATGAVVGKAATGASLGASMTGLGAKVLAVVAIVGAGYMGVGAMGSGSPVVVDEALVTVPQKAVHDAADAAAATQQGGAANSTDDTVSNDPAKDTQSKVAKPNSHTESGIAAQTNVREPATPPTRKDVDANALAEEAALLEKAQQALRQGSHDESLALIEEHARRHPEGALTPEREAVRAMSLCGRANTRVRGQAAAQRFVARHGGSPLAAAVIRSCTKKPR